VRDEIREQGKIKEDFKGFEADLDSLNVFIYFFKITHFFSYLLHPCLNLLNKFFIN